MSHITSRFRKKLKTLPPDRVVRDVARGKDLPSRAIGLFSSGPEAGDDAYLRGLVDAGLINTVLQLLERCEDEKFPDVLGRDGDIPNPAIWLNLLLNAVSGEFATMIPNELLWKSRMEIAKRIGPVVRCMTDYKQRTFFGENRYWWQGTSIVYFVILLQYLMGSPETLSILVEYEGLVNFLIQCIFWESHRGRVTQVHQ